ncbi:MAG: aldehyde dehydrogenase family protein [Deltaproteobacteria bacterium]
MTPIFSTILLDPPAAFALGALAPLLAAPMIRQKGAAEGYGLVAPALAAWMAGVYGYFFFHWPDWMFVYLVEARRLPLSWCYPIFVLAWVGGAWAGTRLATRAIVERRTLIAFGWLGLGLAVWAILFALTADQYVHVGTTLEYRARLAKPLDAAPAFKLAFNLAGIATAIPAVGVALALVLEAVRARRSERAPEAVAVVVPDAGGGAPLEGVSPGDGTPLAPVPTTPPDRLSAVMAAAREAQAVWGSWSVDARVAALGRARARFLAAGDEIASIVCRETGKPLAEAYLAEVVPNADLFSYWVKETPRLLAPEPVPLNPVLYPGKTGTLERLPRGVVALLSPWNYPVAIPLRTLVPALAAGNAVVFKPSELTPRSGALLASILQAELPPGLLQLVQGGGDVGAAHNEAGPDAVAFTGSTATGRKVAELCAKRPIPCALELGGKDAALVLEDCDLGRTVAGIGWGAFTNAGQNCASVERVYVVRSIAEPFLEALSELAAGLRREGELAELGPLISARQLRGVEEQLAEARAAGHRVLGEGVVEGLRAPPAIVVFEREKGNDRLRVLREETFGPLVVVEVVADEAEAVARANESPFGLSASIWTRNLERGERLARLLRAGTISVNNVAFTPALPMAPWSGVGESGYGVTNSPLALDGFTRPRFILLDRTKQPELWWYPYDRNIVEVARGLTRLQVPGRRSLALALRTVKGFLARGASQKAALRKGAAARRERSKRVA